MSSPVISIIIVSYVMSVFFLQTSLVRPFAVAAVLRNVTFTKVTVMPYS